MSIFNKESRITDLLKELGTENIVHIKNGSLYSHLLRVGKLLRDFGHEGDVVHAGMCHSLYGTDFFAKKTLSSDDRAQLRKVIGEEAERLVFLCSAVKRETLHKKAGGYYFLLREEGKDISLSEKEASLLLHILLANDLDHVTTGVPHEWGSTFNLYAPWKHLLLPVPQRLVEAYAVDHTLLPTEERDAVRFIAHAGIQIKTLTRSVVVDPWLHPSDLRNPVLEGFSPGSKTIDYLIPEPKNTALDIAADVILLSHFHTHHSPIREITELLEIRPLTIICPRLSDKKQEELELALGERLFARITLHFIEKDTVIDLGSGVEVSCLTHTHPEHLAFFIKTKNTSVLHISDASVNEDKLRNDFSKTWDKFFALRPDFLFMGAGGHNQIILSGANRDISENGTFTPVQAAKFVARLLPKHAGVIGVYNFSIWDNRQEYAMSTEDIEGMFYWGVSYLAPSVKVHILRPGDSFLGTSEAIRS